jgi:hypothetical protein
MTQNQIDGRTAEFGSAETPSASLSWWVVALTVGMGFGWFLAASQCSAQQTTDPSPDDAVAESVESIESQPDEPAEEVHTIKIPKHWKRLGASELWLDLETKSVIVGGTICLRRGGLEMLVCPWGTKDHESIVSVNAAASEVHAALLAVGAKPGKPVQWEPEYQPVSGSVINIQVTWREPSSKQLVTRWAKELVRSYRTGRALGQDWVFGGSVMEKDPETGETFYWGDGGELVCLSNFSSATIDLNIPSTSSNEGLMYEAFTENLPRRGTKAYVKLTPGKFFGKE